MTCYTHTPNEMVVESDCTTLVDLLAAFLSVGA
jgi:hypothetical protein